MMTAIVPAPVRLGNASGMNAKSCCGSLPDDAAAVAQQLFAVLREFDAQGVKLIWVETPPEGPQWEGVRDRLQRAAAE